MAVAEEEQAVERCCSDTSQDLISLGWVVQVRVMMFPDITSHQLWFFVLIDLV